MILYFVFAVRYCFIIFCLQTKFKDFSSFSNLANDLTNNNNTLIKKKKTEKMKLIKSVDDKANGGTKLLNTSIKHVFFVKKVLFNVIN